MSQARKCAKCGTEMPGGPGSTAVEHCPRCLLELGAAAGGPAQPNYDETVRIPFVPGPPEDKVGDHIGRYTLIEKIGEGGMGCVWVAEQTDPVRQKVALKLIKPGNNTPEAAALFEAERQTLALMNHPNIARLLDAGAMENGRPFYVMEHVEGVPITDYCDRHLLRPGQRLALFIEVCKAFAHAHRNGIIHCDIKPSNILVTVPRGENKPVPKAIDFGLAKASSQFLGNRLQHTPVGQLGGTLAYISPEQAEMTALGIDNRSDIYSLGALLYELLTGQTPLDGSRLAQAGPEGIPRLVREEVALAPSARLSALDAKALGQAASARQMAPRDLIRHLRGDLDWIAMKCLEKDRTRRFKSAEPLAESVERFLRHWPVIEPAAWHYRARKLVQRNRRAFAVGGGAALSAAAVVLILFSVLRPADTPNPASPLRLEIHAWRGTAAQSSSLQDGDSLTSRVDKYVVTARVPSPGYLYILQVDAVGETQWLFPSNHTCHFSSGANPVKRGQEIRIPGVETNTFSLDNNAGLEHIYAVLSPVRWPELEAALEPPPSLTRGVGDTPSLPAGAVISVEPRRDDQLYELYVRGRPLRAPGAFRVLDRWFKHVNSNDAK